MPENTKFDEWLSTQDPARQEWMQRVLGGQWGDPSRPINYNFDPRQPVLDRTNTATGPGPGGAGGDAPMKGAGPTVQDPNAAGQGGPTSIFSYAGGGGGFGGGGMGMSQNWMGKGPAGGDEIVNRLMSNQGQLGQLDPETQKQLAAMKQAELLALEKTMSEQSAGMMEQMFGRGIARSTIAGRVGEQMVASQGLAAAQVESGAAQREIALRQDIANRAIEEMAVASKELESQRGHQVGMAGVEAENNRTTAMMNIAAMETQAKMAIAQGQLDLGYAGLDLEKDRFGFEKTTYWEDLKRKDRQLDIMDKEASNNKRNGWLSLLGGIGGGLLEALPFMSHPATKEYLDPVTPEEAVELLEQINNLPMYKFKYIDGVDEHIGVNAIEAKEINDKLSNGVHLKPLDIMFALMAAVKVLSKRVEELENA